MPDPDHFKSRTGPLRGTGLFFVRPFCPFFLLVAVFTSQKNLQMIHVSKITSICDRKDATGKPVRFSFTALSLKGEVIEGENCVMTSYHTTGRTINIKFPSGEIRKLRLISFIKFNGQEAVI